MDRARDLLPPHNGREIEKTDGFLLLFDQTSDAVAYAIGYHKALRDLDFKARAGLHVGEVILRENSAEDVARGAKPLEVEGIAKLTAAHRHRTRHQIRFAARRPEAAAGTPRPACRVLDVFGPNVATRSTAGAPRPTSPERACCRG